MDIKLSRNGGKILVHRRIMAIAIGLISVSITLSAATGYDNWLQSNKDAPLKTGLSSIGNASLTS